MLHTALGVTVGQKSQPMYVLNCAASMHVFGSTPDPLLPPLPAPEANPPPAPEARVAPEALLAACAPPVFPNPDGSPTAAQAENDKAPASPNPAKNARENMIWFFWLMSVNSFPHTYRPSPS